MEIQSKRYLFGNDFTLSNLSIDGENFIGCPFILEDKVRETDESVEKWKIKAVTAIPRGRYEVNFTFSNRFQKLTLQLLNVPGFEGIRVHSGNTSHDTEGCLITGKEKDEEHGEVSKSRLALEALEMRVHIAINRGEHVFWRVL